LSKLTPTTILIIANILVFAYTSVVGGSFPTTSTTELRLLGQYNQYVVSHGWYWQLFTSIFVHVDIIHLLLNMIFLLIFGFRAEELFSEGEFFTIYFVSGIVGSLLTLLMPLNTVSAGASGAIFGMFGAVLIYLRKMLGGSIIGALIISFYFLLLNSASPQINLFAHFGGLVAGLLIGYILAKSRKIIL
jgi:rhomboid protease GluP